MFNKKLFREEIAARGLTIKELSSAIGVNAATMYRKMNEKTEFTRKEIQEICDALDIGAQKMQSIFFSENLD